MDTMRVIFRADRHGLYKGDVTAVFPDEPEYEGNMVCYAHIGQHSRCSLGWYRTTRPATETEYADLLAELRGIYETGDDPVRLVVAKRR